MPAKITRLDARRDPEAVEWAKELRETETWFHSERFGHITRLHTPSKSCRSAAACRRITRSPENRRARCTTICSGFSSKKTGDHLWPLLVDGSGASGDGRHQSSLSGGWATSAKGSESEDLAQTSPTMRWTASPRKGLRGCGPCCIKMRCNGPTGSG